MLTVAVVSLSVINLGLIAFLVLKKPAFPSPRDEHHKQRNIVVEKLRLTEAQTARYDQLLTEHQTEIKRLNDEIRKTKNNLFKTLTRDSESNEDFFISRLGALQRQVETAHYTHFAALKNLCTPQQNEKFNTLTQDFADYFAADKNQSMHP